MTVISEPEIARPMTEDAGGGPKAAWPASVLRVNRPVRQRGRILFGIASVWVVAVVLAAIFADALPLDPYSAPVGPPQLRPRLGWEHILGTDSLGRSNLSRVIYGARVSLAVGLVSVLLSMLVGGLFGLLGGYFRGRVDAVISVLTDTLLAFPPLILLLAVTATMGTNLRNLILALALVNVPTFARLTRANTISFSSREFVLAARGLGARPRTIIFRELLGNVAFPVGSYAFLIIAVVIVAEGSLSFLGLGIPPPTPSWGGMIASGQQDFQTAPHLVFVPAAFMFITVFSFNIIGDRARARFSTTKSAV